MPRYKKLVDDPISAILFVSLCILWSFTWLMGKYQVNSGILPEIAVFYRFIPISIIMALIALFCGQSLKFNLRDCKILFIYSFCCCSVNFILFYYAAIYTITSISAIIFSFSIIIIALLKYFFVRSKEPIKAIIISSILGTAGLIFIMWQKIISFMGTNALIGALIGVIATFIYSIGSLFYERKKNILTIKPIPSFAIISVFGSIISFFVFLFHNLVSGEGFVFIPNFSKSFIFSYIYLIFSGFGVLMIMLLIKRIGAVKAAYVNLITPVVATLTSSIFEDYTILFSTVIGIALVFMSNYFAILTKEKT